MIPKRQLVGLPGAEPGDRYPYIPNPDDFEGAASDFLKARDVHNIAALLIDHYEGEFAHLRHFSIGYAWKRSGGGSGGNMTLGKCVKPSGLLAYFSKHDFVIWLAADHLRDMEASYWQIEALVYHELLHAQMDDEKKTPITRGHDFEGFADEIENYGAWSRSGELLERAFYAMQRGETA